MDTPDGYAPTQRGTAAVHGGDALGVSQDLLFASFYPGERPSAARLGRLSGGVS